MIDCHIHLGRIRYGRHPLTIPSLLSWMDSNSIEKACIMATENPEELHYYSTSEQVLEYAKISDRLIPFCNIDPRIGAKPIVMEKIIKDYADRGAKGFGEIIVKMNIDDIRLVKIYEICGDLDLPVLIHMNKGYAADDDGLTKLRAVLKYCPKTNFILHSAGWWCNQPAVERVLKRFPNAYGDISAGSGYRFLTGLKNLKEFLQHWNKRLIFGTDYLEPGQECPIIDLIKNQMLSDEEGENITRKNLLGILRP